MEGCYIGRNADLGMISERTAQLLKNQNMLSAAHLSSGKCPGFGIHYNGNCSRQNYLVLDELDQTSETCMSIGSISRSLGGWNQGLYVGENQSGNWHKHLIGDITGNCTESSILTSHFHESIQSGAILWGFFSFRYMSIHLMEKGRSASEGSNSPFGTFRNIYKVWWILTAGRFQILKRCFCFTPALAARTAFASKRENKGAQRNTRKDSINKNMPSFMYPPLIVSFVSSRLGFFPSHISGRGALKCLFCLWSDEDHLHPIWKVISEQNCFPRTHAAWAESTFFQHVNKHIISINTSSNWQLDFGSARKLTDSSWLL